MSLCSVLLAPPVDGSWFLCTVNLGEESFQDNFDGQFAREHIYRQLMRTTNKESDNTVISDIVLNLCDVAVALTIVKFV